VLPCVDEAKSKAGASPLSRVNRANYWGDLHEIRARARDDVN
jgi:hypothetical protein